MPEFVFLTVGDVHISDINPRSRIDNFKETVLGKLNQVRLAASKLKADAVLFTGDLYNIKAPLKNSHNLNSELIELFHRFKCPVYSICGNHDLTGNNLDSLSHQPIRSLFTSKAVKQLGEDIITKKDDKISLVGFSYQEDLNPSKLHIPPKGDCKYQICVLHIYAGPKPGVLYKEKLHGYEELSKLGPDCFVLGHYHIDQGIQQVNGKTFINLGAITRGILIEDNLSHKPKMGFLRIQCEKNGAVIVTTEEIPISIQPPEEVFNLEKRATEKQEFVKMQEFVNKLVAEAEESNKTKNVGTEMDKMKIAEEIKERVLNLIKEAELLRKI
jgi:DNA repair exonuclease SbcCD nuclease subunit